MRGAMVAAACGSGAGGAAGDSEPPAKSGATPAETTSAAEASPTTTADVEAPEVPMDDEKGPGPCGATVTLDDDTYSFSSEGAIVAQCLTDLFEIVSVSCQWPIRVEL